MIRVRLPEAEPAVIAGVESWLTSHPGITVAEEFPDSSADVYVAVAGLVDRHFVETVGATARRIGAVVVLALDNMPDEAIDAAVRARVAGLLPRGTMNRESLVAAVLAAAEGNSRCPAVAAEELFKALDEVRETVCHQPMAVLGERDVELLRMIACGLDTLEIAARLSLAHRTVVNRVQAVVRKCGAQNRCEAVAKAARVGLV